MEQLEWLADDSLPYLEVFTGTEIVAAAFDCPVHFPESDMPFAMPIIQQASEVAAIRLPHLDHPAIAPLFQIAEDLRARAGEDALLPIVDLQSPMDTAALIWEKTGFYPAMVDAPEAVHELSGKVQAFLEAFLDTWFSRFGREFIAHYPDYYMPYGITCSVDEVGVVSAHMFRDFFMPELVSLSERYGQMGIHCCANAKHLGHSTGPFRPVRAQFLKCLQAAKMRPCALLSATRPYVQKFRYSPAGLLPQIDRQPAPSQLPPGLLRR
jgi:hypothetical protein